MTEFTGETRIEHKCPKCGHTDEFDEEVTIEVEGPD